MKEWIWADSVSQAFTTRESYVSQCCFNKGFVWFVERGLQTIWKIPLYLQPPELLHFLVSPYLSFICSLTISVQFFLSPEASTPDKQVFIVSLPCKHLFFLKFQVSLLLCDISSLMGLKFVILYSRQKSFAFERPYYTFNLSKLWTWAGKFWRASFQLLYLVQKCLLQNYLIHYILFYQ